MNDYFDVVLKPDAEMRENVLLNKVYTKLHKALSTMQTRDIGVSFPRYEKRLGDVVRIHGEENRLQILQSMNWLGGLSGYCDVADVQPIPAQVKYRTVSRIQSNMTQSKLNRLLNRGTITHDEIKQYKAKMFQQGLNNPYLELESATNGHKHRRFIEFGELMNEASAGSFDEFGLSKSATIPWF